MNLANNTSNRDASRIEKEYIPILHFSVGEVLFSRHDRERRDTELSKALFLGNVNHIKVRIYFQDQEEVRLVETTIWGVTDTEVILKRGITIPKRRIIEIQTI